MIDKMTTEYGTVILTGTRGTDLIMADGSVAGVIGTNGTGGTTTIKEGVYYTILDQAMITRLETEGSAIGGWMSQKNTPLPGLQDQIAQVIELCHPRSVRRRSGCRFLHGKHLLCHHGDRWFCHHVRLYGR